jgi:hypothetical protein
MAPFLENAGRASLAFACVIVGALLSACAPVTELSRVDALNVSTLFCGSLGGVCCRPPVSVPPDLGPIVSCNDGLGCDVQNNVCVQPCGDTSQVCCDGSKTRAIKWTPSGALYSPNSPFMIEMCSAGSCDVKTHRCFACGTKPNEACCGPDAEQVTARCLDSHLECRASKPPALSLHGICMACGTQGNPPCYWGCDSGLEPDAKGNCNVCGGNMQVPCARGCDPGLNVAGGLCRQCGHAGQIHCDKGCFDGLKIVNGICTACGTNGLPPCSGVCDPGFTPQGNVCVPCGGLNQVTCNHVCNYPLREVNGRCMFCGGNGQVPCDTGGCNTGLVVIGGLCKPPPPPPGICCPAGCVQDGNHCVRTGPNPVVCATVPC